MSRWYCAILTLLALVCKCPTAFVVGPSRARLTTETSRRDLRAARTQPSFVQSDIDCGEWRTATGLPIQQSRKVGSRGGKQRRRAAAGGRGVGNLRAGMDMPPVELVANLGDALMEQILRHHYPSAFIGGTVGVLGTLTAIQIKINQVKELTACPYCRSTGQLTCATCLGTGYITVHETAPNTNEVTTTTLTCPTCRGKTFVTCVNCKGDGRGVPLFLNKKVSRDPESEIEDVGYA